MTTCFLHLPDAMSGPLTWDRGVELTRHHDFSAATGVPVYFCDAYCPWQRGSHENTNGLLRQYFPKKADLSQFTPDQVQAAVDELNNRPRQVLGWKTAREVFDIAAVAMTA